jgi:hypothetical protein
MKYPSLACTVEVHRYASCLRHWDIGGETSKLLLYVTPYLIGDRICSQLGEGWSARGALLSTPAVFYLTC